MGKLSAFWLCVRAEFPRDEAEWGARSRPASLLGPLPLACIDHDTLPQNETTVGRILVDGPVSGCFITPRLTPEPGCGHHGALGGGCLQSRVGGIPQAKNRSCPDVQTQPERIRRRIHKETAMLKKLFLGTLVVTFVAAFGAVAVQAGSKVQVCHIPPGNPDNFHTITVNENALQAHLGHGDLPGSCSANADALCNDGNACTIDAMNAETETCLADHPPVDCNDSNLCTQDSCDPTNGCQSAPIACDDANACTVDACNPSNGQCTASPINCGPLGYCLPETGACDFPCDGITCDPIDQCHAPGECVLSGTAGACEDGGALPDGTACDDGNTGTDGDVCTAGACAGTPSTRFVDNGCGGGTVKDTETGLCWLKKADCLRPATWGDQMANAAALGDGQCGLTDGSSPGDWRLPTADCPTGTSAGCPAALAAGEFLTLYASACPKPKILDTIGTGCWSEGDPFTGLNVSQQAGLLYWSSNPNGNGGFPWYFRADGVVPEVGTITNAHQIWGWPVRNELP